MLVTLKSISLVIKYFVQTEAAMVVEYLFLSRTIVYELYYSSFQLLIDLSSVDFDETDLFQLLMTNISMSNNSHNTVDSHREPLETQEPSNRSRYPKLLSRP